MKAINTTNIEQAKKLIKSSAKPIIVRAQDIDFNRKILEYGKFDILFSPESAQGKKSLRAIDSGLDYIMARSAAKNKVAIGIDFKFPQERKEKALLLAKIRQNIMLCRKAKAGIKAINYKDKKDSLSLLLSLGASTKQASEALD